MRKLIFIMIAAVIGLQAFSQEDQSVDAKTARQMAREQRKLENEKQSKIQAAMVDSLINQRNFVIQANYLGDQTGDRVVVDNKINFILVDSSSIKIQYGSISNGLLGYNGLGGLTTDGSITKFEVTRLGKDKKGGYTIQMVAMTSVGIYDVVLNVSPDGNATATIGGNTRGKLVYYGDIRPINGSRIYEGSSI